MKFDPRHCKPPENWDNHDQWNEYWANQSDALPQAEVWSPWRNEPELRFIDFVRNQSQRKVWFAGCGISFAPIFYAYAGCNVLASDVSVVAIDFLRQVNQQGITSLVSNVEEMNTDLKMEQTQATDLRFLVHDFREPLDEYDFDVILNIKAYQGLPTTSMKQAATTFYKALKTGGYAIFDTQNVQGDYRNQIEDSLLDVGFYIPFHKSERWYREQLNSTGIVYVMVLGGPLIPQWGQYGDDDWNTRASQDQEILYSFYSEYQKQREQESKEVQEILKGKQTKIAHVVYNTG
ncbi:MAG: class I SAM-dependent methyltransferase [Nostoc sp.]|uniref:class I SAM-dependent methyltransferase n=1 Tax=Nostoc sp. TaxID=1180 RepID=UPI002FF8A7BA